AGRDDPPGTVRRLYVLEDGPVGVARLPTETLAQSAEGGALVAGGIVRLVHAQAGEVVGLCGAGRALPLAGGAAGRQTGPVVLPEPAAVPGVAACHMVDGQILSRAALEAVLSAHATRKGLLLGRVETSSLSWAGPTRRHSVRVGKTTSLIEVPHP